MPAKGCPSGEKAGEPGLFRILAIVDRDPGSEPALPSIPPSGLAVLLRAKHLPTAERRRLASLLRRTTADRGVPLLVGGDVWLAREVGADGVHLPASMPPVACCDLVVGCSCHDEAELRRAAEAGVDFATLSPVLASPGKGDPLGWERFESLARAAALPVFALGGMAPDMLAQARRRGAWGVAGIRAFAFSLALALAPGCPRPADDDSGADDDASDDDISDDDSAVDDPVPVDVEPPASFEVECAGVEPDDVDVDGLTVPQPPWPQATPCGEVPADADGGLVLFAGSIQDIVVGTWQGDNDTFSFVAQDAMAPRAVLRWDPLQGDLDAKVMCPRFSGWSDVFSGGLATAALAEQAEATFEVEAGSTCYVFVAGFDGLVADFELWLE